ncbi:MAG: hypothetical protein ABL874_13745, partial [Sphingopyxis sp.]
MRRATKTFYFHGQPGGVGELALLGGAPTTSDWMCYDRSRVISMRGEGCFDALAARVLRDAGGQPCRLIGFSLGAMAALQIAERLGEAVERIDLISAAAPLQLGDFLPHMAGRPLFELAAHHPGLFGLVAGAQGLLARFAPRLLARSLLATGMGADAALFADPR